MQKECDVLVVGAGPAGSIAAKFAAMSGAGVLMVEKRQELDGFAMKQTSTKMILYS